MTFYWWSHWFWITCLSVQLLPNAIPHVHTYPSQEISLELTRQEEQLSQLPTRLTTKLYQTTSSLTWSTATPGPSNIMDLTLKPSAAATATATATYSDERVDEGEQDEVDDEVEMSAAAELDDEADSPLAAAPNQNEFKRSADFVATGNDAADVSLPAEQLNNYTNFSSSTSTNNTSSNTSSSTTAANDNRSPETATTAIITKTTSTTSTVAPLSSTGSTAGAAAATPSTPKIQMEWLAAAASDELQKAPFTLENVNANKAEEELRRADNENEHRSRKSKVLSAEYKHINRYINFSSDTKSLLTRSASAAPEADEGNISSEALAIQRTYFLDAGAISAICFTVFGICCTVATIGIVLYRRRYLNKPQALSEPDSSVYIDDSTMRDNSDEMYSLDNDSFLNSLEAMTIQNYWTDTVKHTKL